MQPEEKIAFPYDVTFLPSGPGGQYVPVGASGWKPPPLVPTCRFRF